MKKQIGVIGLGAFGLSLAQTLEKLGHEVLAIDSNPKKLNSLADEFTHSMIANVKDEETVRSLGLSGLDIVVVCIGEDIQTSVLLSLLLKEIGVKKVVAKAINPMHGKLLEKIGVDLVIFPERDMGVRVAQNLVAANVLDYLELADDYGISEIKAPNEFIGKTIGDLDLRAKYGINVIVIKHENEIIVSPGADATICEDDKIIVIGTNNQVAELSQL